LLVIDLDSAPKAAGHIKFSCLDEDIFGSDLVGETTVPLREIVDEAKPSQDE
jgi:hypothetical protein